MRFLRKTWALQGWNSFHLTHSVKYVPWYAHVLSHSVYKIAFSTSRVLVWFTFDNDLKVNDSLPQMLDYPRLGLSRLG